MNSHNVYTIEPLGAAGFPEWDAFVDSHPRAWITHRAAWERIARHVWRNLVPHYLIVRNGAGHICMGFPLCIRRSATGGRRLVSAPFSTLTDPLFTCDSALQYFFANLHTVLRNAGADSLEFRTFRATASIPAHGLRRCNDHVVHGVGLQRSEPDLLAACKRDIRYRIRKSLESGLQVRQAESTAELERFYALYAANRRRLGLPAVPWRFFEGAWIELRPLDSIELLLACDGGKLVGGLFNLKYRDRVSAEALAYREDYSGMNPTHLLYWTAIQTARQAGKCMYDFGRTPVGNQGLIQFKERWGSESVVLPTFIYPATGGRVHQGTPLLVDTVRALVRHLPAPLYRAVSALFYARPR